MKQSELAVKLGVSKSYMSEIEKGMKAPTIELINKYSEVFAIPASSILFFAENIEQPPSNIAAQRARQFVAVKIIKLLQFLEERSGHAHAR